MNLHLQPLKPKYALSLPLLWEEHPWIKKRWWDSMTYKLYASVHQSVVSWTPVTNKQIAEVLLSEPDGVISNQFWEMINGIATEKIFAKQSPLDSGYIFTIPKLEPEHQFIKSFRGSNPGSEHDLTLYQLIHELIWVSGNKISPEINSQIATLLWKNPSALSPNIFWVLNGLWTIIEKSQEFLRGDYLPEKDLMAPYIVLDNKLKWLNLWEKFQTLRNKVLDSLANESINRLAEIKFPPMDISSSDIERLRNTYPDVVKNRESIKWDVYDFRSNAREDVKRQNSNFWVQLRAGIESDKDRDAIYSLVNDIRRHSLAVRHRDGTNSENFYSIIRERKIDFLKAK
jgi:hypothetical protein